MLLFQQQSITVSFKTHSMHLRGTRIDWIKKRGTWDFFCWDCPTSLLVAEVALEAAEAPPPPAEDVDDDAALEDAFDIAITKLFT